VAVFFGANRYCYYHSGGFVYPKPKKILNCHFMAYKTNRINYQVVMLVWGFTRTGAINRLNTIRQRLQMPQGKMLNVVEYCKAEDITIDDFDMMMRRAQEKL
jgi:hypothetical protein